MHDFNDVCDLLRDLVSFVVQFKKREKQPWRSFSKVAG